MKPFLRRLALPFAGYHAYQSKTFGYDGWYSIGRFTVAFKGTDGHLSFNW